MISDLVMRLRARRQDYPHEELPDQLCLEAANVIEAMAARPGRYIEGFDAAIRQAQTACLLTMREDEPFPSAALRAIIVQECARAISALKPAA